MLSTLKQCIILSGGACMPCYRDSYRSSVSLPSAPPVPVLPAAPRCSRSSPGHSPAPSPPSQHSIPPTTGTLPWAPSPAPHTAPHPRCPLATKSPWAELPWTGPGRHLGVGRDKFPRQKLSGRRTGFLPVTETSK